jgi:hydroxymethylpyrimidine/phosphomethylpyrimidine kinase
MTHERPVCLSIGTSASSGGAGVQVDVKTFTALGCHGAAIITAVSAQNFTAVRATHVIPDDIIREQLVAAADELPVAAVKVGLVPSVGAIRIIGRWLRERPELVVVVDPVVADSKGIARMQPEALDALRREILPRATLLTPNRFQAALLAGQDECLGEEMMEDAAKEIFHRFGCPTVVSGGGLGACRDVFIGLDGLRHFESVGPSAKNVHGLGSAFSAAITASLARGDSLREAILSAQMFIAECLTSTTTYPLGIRPLWLGVSAIPVE